MKSIRKTIVILILAALLVFSMAACDLMAFDKGNDNASVNQYGPTHFTGTLTFGSGQQIWQYNRESGQISDLYKSFTQDRDVIIFVNIFNSSNEIIGEEIVGTGTITGGILHVSVVEPEARFLFGWDALKKINFFYWEDVAADTEEVRGNEFMFRTTRNERLNLEIITGTAAFLSQELVRFIYVDRSTRVTGRKSADGIIEGGGGMTSTFFYTENDLDMVLETGWNTLYRKQTFYTDARGDGRSGITLLLKNPLHFKWVLYPEGYDGHER